MNKSRDLDQHGLSIPRLNNTVSGSPEHLDKSGNSKASGVKIQKLTWATAFNLPTNPPVEASGKGRGNSKQTEEEALQKRQIAFMTWTHELNQKAAVKDYLALPEEMPKSEVPVTSPDETHPVSEKVSPSPESRKEEIENETDRR